MDKMGTIITCLIVFAVTGVVAYVLESIIFRNKGTIGRYEGLWEYYRKIDQKEGNIAVIVFAALWVLLMILCALFLYFIS